MNINMIKSVRFCPNCLQERPIDELYCESPTVNGTCGWPLSDEVIRQAGMPLESVASSPLCHAPQSRYCTNGHPLDAGDQMCMTCGAEPAVTSDSEPTQAYDPADETVTIIDGWRVLSRFVEPAERQPWERFIVEHTDTSTQALLTLYHSGSEPDPAVHDILRRMPLDHIPVLLATGRFAERAYEVFELIGRGTLAEAGYFASKDPAGLKCIIDELGRALESFAEVGLRHRDIRPGTILLRTRDPLDLVISGFGSARLSDFDLEAVAPLELTRYSAPEAIVGAVSAASDWWSLGMIILEHITAGACFVGVNDRAFHIHVVTRGVSLPDQIDPVFRPVLKGLLTRDPIKRWTAADVRAWLAGDHSEVPDEQDGEANEPSGPTLDLGGVAFASPELFALAGAESDKWEEAKDLLLRGRVTTWLEQRDVDRAIVSRVRRIMSDDGLSENSRHALAIMAMNPSLPLTMSGDIVTPAWLLAHPGQAYDMVTGEVARHLELIDREPWLVRMRTRAEGVRERAQLLEIELDESRVRVAILASSRTNLEVERTALRTIYPDTDHPGLASLLERAKLSDEDLIVLVSAAAHQFVPVAAIVDNAFELAAEVGIGLNRAEAENRLKSSRRELFMAVDERIANFSRCGLKRIDDWADAFRVERRMTLPRAIVLLNVPAAAWNDPPSSNMLRHCLNSLRKESLPRLRGDRLFALR
ncbi:hypothetical protein LMIY3S_00019 [Labrys miyagiensis]